MGLPQGRLWPAGQPTRLGQGERDAKFSRATWSVGNEHFRLQQCHGDTQVWKIVRGRPEATQSTGVPPEAAQPTGPEATQPTGGTALRIPSPDPGEELLGLLICYVDDLLLLMKSGPIRQGLIDCLRKLWTMSTEVDLKFGQPFTFLGLEIERAENGDLHVHQRTFIRKLLVDHGFDVNSKGIRSVTMAMPTAEDKPPDAKLLKQLQQHGGEFNWLATRTRPDLAYFTSVVASAAKDHGLWIQELCKKVLRYLLATRDQGLTFPRVGPEPPGGHGEASDPKQLVV